MKQTLSKIRFVIALAIVTFASNGPAKDLANAVKAALATTKTSVK